MTELAVRVDGTVVPHTPWLLYRRDTASWRTSVLQYVSIDWLTDSTAGRQRYDLVHFRDTIGVQLTRRTRMLVSDGRWGLYMNDCPDLFVGCTKGDADAVSVDPCLLLNRGDPLALPPRAEVIVGLLSALDNVLTEHLTGRPNESMPPPVSTTNVIGERLRGVLQSPDDDARVARRLRLEQFDPEHGGGGFGCLSAAQYDATYAYALGLVTIADREFSTEKYISQF